LSESNAGERTQCGQSDRLKSRQLKGLDGTEVLTLIHYLLIAASATVGAVIATSFRPGATRAHRPSPHFSSHTGEFRVILKAGGANTIATIKAVRDVTALGLKEAKDLVDQAGDRTADGISKDEAFTIAKRFEGVATVQITESLGWRYYSLEGSAQAADPF
jgi:large subunit ribosomal protein L7/L12